MEKVGVRELRINLSRYLRGVKQGKELLVTDRGRVIAKIMPVEEGGKDERFRSVFLGLADKGYVILPHRWGKPRGKPVRARVQGTPFSDAVIEGRR
jgi:prevent-host-death family protein